MSQSSTLLVWGKGDHGQLGLGGGLDDPRVPLPVEVNHTPWQVEGDPADEVAQISGGARHSLLMTSSGSLYSCGTNDTCQLGHDRTVHSRYERLDSVEQYKMVSIACGEAHNLAMDEWGKTFSWGDDSDGQCGHNTGSKTITLPKMIRGLGTVQVSQVACGSRHSLVLAYSGRLFAFGDNSHGQLGLGNAVGGRTLTPQPVMSLSGLPVLSIACGGHHSIVVSESGAVYAWGKNDHGQLGLGDRTNRNLPAQVRSLRSQDVRRVSCGQDHTVCLTGDGGVFSFGAGGYGQLGHGGKGAELLPRKILELMGTEVTQIACGKLHTLALVPSRGRLYTFGLGATGIMTVALPQVVKGPWANSNGESLVPYNGKPKTLYAIGAGGSGTQSFAVMSEQPSAIPDQREPTRGTLKFTSGMLNKIESLSTGQEQLNDFLEDLEIVFQSHSCLNSSFLLNPGHKPSGSRNCGLDFDAWRRAFKAIENCQHDTIKDAVHSFIISSIIPGLPTNPPDVETLRIFLILPMYHRFGDASLFELLQTPYCDALISLGKNPWGVMERWLGQRDRDYIRTMVINLKAVVVELLKRRVKNGGSGYRRQLESSLLVLRLLNRLNVEQGLIISYEDLYIPEVNQLLNLPQEYFDWLMEKSGQFVGGGGEFRICDYPFVFDATSKTLLLQVDQQIQMHNARQQAQTSAVFNFMMGNLSDPEGMQYLVLNVSRENLLQDTLVQAQQISVQDLKKPLRVQFVGEAAEDAGGVRKEFFLLLMKEILDPKYGMFKIYEETRTIWFHPQCFEDDVMFFLIGLMCGLAIYNFIIVNLPFPLPLYKKLLGGTIGTVEDLEELSPTIARSLRDLLQYEGEDFEDTFGLAFSVTEECYGEQRTVELKKNGNSIPVTKDNRKEYVDLYCQYILMESVKHKFAAFHTGFHKVCGGRVLDLFHARELMSLVVGNENYNWRELQESCQYKNGYSAEHQTVKNFWTVFHEELTEEQRKMFLLFLTGCDRIPILGMKSLNMHIQRTSDTNYLPVAHTCFNLLDLPEYATKERLKFKLIKAIQHFQGFGLA